MFKRLVLLVLAAAAALALTASPAAAEPAVGVIDGTNLLVTFDTANPATFTAMKHVTGLGVGERLVGVDFRWHPNNETNPLPPSQLFGLGVVDGLASDTARLYTIDPATAVATPVGSAITVPTGGDSYGVDFNPTVDRLRVVNDADENVRVNPNNGSLAGDDTNLAPAGREVSGLAYDRVDIQIPPLVPGNTTLYGISVAGAKLVTIGGVNQSPSPNTGLIFNEKALGLSLVPESPAGFDISPTGIAYAALVDASGQPGLYTINLASGAATSIGSLTETLSGFAIVPEAIPPPVVVPVAPAAPDTTAPSVALEGAKASMPLKAFLKGVSVKVVTGEPASLEAELLTSAKSARLASLNLILAEGSSSLAAGPQTLTLKPSRRLVGKPKKAFKATLRVTATDAAKNATVDTRTITVKPAAKKKKAKR